MSILNQFSFVVFALIGAVILVLGMWRLKQPQKPLLRGLVLAIYAGILTGSLLFIDFPDSSVQVSDFDEIESTLNNGRPTFVMMYSHFCVGCIAALPDARQLEVELYNLGQPLDMLFLDVHSGVGRAAREPLGFNISPTYVLYDANGQEAMRSNSIFTVESIANQLASTDNQDTHS